MDANNSKIDCKTLNNNNLVWEQDTHELIYKWQNNSEWIEFQTSGSTGKPKKILANKIDLQNSAKRTLRHFSITDGIILNCLSTKYIAGAMQVIRSLVSTCQLQNLEPQKDPFESQKIDWKNVQILSLVPYQLEYLIEKYTSQLKQCKVILLGGAPCSNMLKTKALNLGFDNIFETYGMTETLSHIAVKNSTKDSVFTCLDGVKITKDENQRLIVTDTILKINNLITNDLVDIIDNKKFRWLGRFDYVINSGGFKFFPEEIEQKLTNCINLPFFVFGLDHTQLGQSINLLIENKDELLGIEHEIKKQIANSYELPKNIFYLESFEKTATGKTNRLETIAKLLKK